MEAVKVFCRCKPTSPEAAATSVLRSAGANAILDSSARSNAGPPLEFTFTDVIDPNQTNAEVFATVGVEACDAVLAGYNGAILAFGQTASGKTHTILGSAADPGLIPRSMERLFVEKDAATSEEVRTVRVAFLEVYNERVFDLLERCAMCAGVTDDLAGGGSYHTKAVFHCGHVVCHRCAESHRFGRCATSGLATCPSCPATKQPTPRLLCRRGVASGLPISDVPASGGRFLSGATEVSVTSEAEVAQLVRVGGRARKTAATAMNEHSSRSHAVLIATVEHRHIRSGRARTGQLYLADLAGSENLARSGAARLKETYSP